MRIFIVLLLISVQSQSQITKNTPCEGSKILFDTIMNVYINGKKGVEVIEKVFFQTSFQLEVSDDSAQIISYYIYWHNNATGISYTRSNKGNFVDPDTDSKDEEYRIASSLKQLKPGFKLAFDMILIKKGGNCYILPPLIIDVN